MWFVEEPLILMEGLDAEAARKLAVASTELRQLESTLTAQMQEQKDSKQRIDDTRSAVRRLQREREGHERNRDALLNAIAELNGRNSKLANDVMTKKEIKDNLVAQLSRVAVAQQHVALAMDQSAMQIQILAAEAEASVVTGDHALEQLRDLEAQRAHLSRAAAAACNELSRLKVHCDKSVLESQYIERTLQE